MGYRIVLLIKSSQLWLSSKRSTSVQLIEPFIWSILGLYFLTELRGKYQRRSKWDMHEMNFNTLITVPPVFIKSKFICISDLIIRRLPAFLLVPVISSLCVSWRCILYRDLDLLFLVFFPEHYGSIQRRKVKRKRRICSLKVLYTVGEMPTTHIYITYTWYCPLKIMFFCGLLEHIGLRHMQLLLEWPSEHNRSTGRSSCVASFIEL